MATLETFIAELPPLQQDDTGTIRVGGTRVTLDTIVGAWEDGATAEEIVQSYDVLALADVYAVISYYLHNQSHVQEYLRRREQKAGELRREIELRFPPDDLRARLMARRQSQRSA